MQRPDYQGGSIVNLMASLVRARGRERLGSTQYPSASLLPPKEIAAARHVVLLVLDGLGNHWLQRRAPGGFLNQHRAGALSSVFPPTTASAITTYLTGDAPQQHSLTGWFMWLTELGCTMSVLPGTPRYGGVGYSDAGIDVTALFGHRSVFEQLDTPSVVVSPRTIARSDFNLAHLGPAKLRPFKGIKSLVRTVARSVRRARQPTTVYGYWPGLDAIGHKDGIESDQAVAHLEQIEQQLEWLIAKLAGTDTLVIISADHGQLDCTPADQTDLGSIPELVDCLRIPLCGEPRAAYCYVRPHRTERFEQLCADRLGDQFDLHRSQDLIDQGLFGLGVAHPRLHERVGDYTLIARGRAAIHDALPFSKPFQQIGVHGGLSADELMVPLILLRA